MNSVDFTPYMNLIEYYPISSQQGRQNLKILNTPYTKWLMLPKLSGMLQKDFVAVERPDIERVVIALRG